jgi:hypothetical protein
MVNDEWLAVNDEWLAVNDAFPASRLINHLLTINLSP